MYINKALLESSAVTKHFMTDRERRTKKALCQLLIDRGHRKYAERFWKLDFNIVDSKTHPDFTAAISFDEATVYISDGFLGSGQGVFNQLDVLLRHELAHNLMMHQVRLMYVFKKQHAQNPDEAYEHISYSASLHELLNFLEDFEISNKRYTQADKKIVATMQLNGQVISGLITEEHRQAWANMSLEQMYEEMSKELIQINSEIRSNPAWVPTKDGTLYSDIDALKAQGAGLIKRYNDVMRPSGIKCPVDIFMKSKTFKDFAPIFKKLIKTVYDTFKDFTSDEDQEKMSDLIADVANTGPQKEFDLINPNTGEIVCTLYTPEDKLLATDILKNLCGNINYNPKKFSIKKKTHSKEYTDAWNQVITKLDNSKYDDSTLSQLIDELSK